MIRSACFILALLLVGCSTPTFESFDNEANYAYVFKGMRSPIPHVIHSRVERDERRLFGIKTSPANGNWEFEIVAPAKWVDEVKVGFSPTSFHDVPKRDLPSWFCPHKEEFEVFRMQSASFPAAHLYIERRPKDPDKVRVFIRRH
jgi:hypothetical protein